MAGRKRKGPDEPDEEQPSPKRPRFEVPEPTRRPPKGRKWKLTKLAKLLGPEPIFDDGSSGFTPIDVVGKTEIEMERDQWKCGHQQKYLWEFDTKSLQTIDAVLPLIDDKRQSTLTNSIHPIFRQENWMKRQDLGMNSAFWRIGMGYEGYWEGHNPVVWDLLQPILRLATMILMHANVTQWWDALLFGERKLIDPPSQEIPGLRSFHRREAPVFYAERWRVLQAFAQVSGNIVWRIAHGNTDIDKGTVSLDSKGYKTGADFIAITRAQGTFGKEPVHIALGMCLLTPFLDKRGMTDSEKLAMQYYAASTMVHELAHAIGDLYTRLDPNEEQKFPTHELFFEDEALAEYGCSMTVAMAEYITDFVPKKSPKEWALAWFCQHWPRTGDVQHSTNVKYERAVPSLQLPQYHYPVSAKFFTDIVLQEFWETYVQVYMHLGDVLRVGKFAAGVSFDREAPNRPPHGNGLLWVDGPPNRPLGSPPDLSVPGQALAYAIAADKLADQDRAARLLKRVRDDIIDWNRRCQRNRQRRLDNPDGPDSPFPDNMPPPVPAGIPPNLDLLPGNESDFEYHHSNFLQPPQRFVQIHTFMCWYRFILGLDTMLNRVPINLLLEYVNREWVLSENRNSPPVGPEEFYDYIKYLVDEQEECFDMLEGPLKSADITYKDEGWPSLGQLTPHPRPALPLHNSPGNIVQLCVDNIPIVCTHKHFWTGLKTHTGHRDIDIDLDIEDIRQRFNHDISVPFDAETWVNAVARCPQIFAFGPRGVIRYVGPDPWPDAKLGGKSPPIGGPYALKNWDTMGVGSSDGSDDSDGSDGSDDSDVSDSDDQEDSDTEMLGA